MKFTHSQRPNECPLVTLMGLCMLLHLKVGNDFDTFVTTHSKHYKNFCNLPLAFRHVYGHYTRGKQLSTCKWPCVRCVVDPSEANCTTVHVATKPCVFIYTWLIVSHVYLYTRSFVATCFTVHVANCQPYVLIYTWQNFRNLIFFLKLIN